MGFLKISMAVFLLATSWLWNFLGAAGRDVRGITENECAQLSDAEIVWDQNKYRWMCCIIKNEYEYENCIPISDLKPLPKTSLKPFPPPTPKAIKSEKQ